MAKSRTKQTSRYQALVMSLGIALMSFSASSAHAQDGDYHTDPCIDALGFIGCANLVHPNNVRQQIVVLRWAAVAFSRSGLNVGDAHGQNSEAAADQAAQSNCRRLGSLDCKVVLWARNECEAIAVSSVDKQAGWGAGLTRSLAGAEALRQCRAAPGQKCRVVDAPCSDDDPRWASPLPSPPPPATANVDPRAVGSWEMLRNPGVWVWNIAADGTYEFHSLAMDGAPSQAGTVSISGGKWSIQATNNGYTDGGDYTFQTPTTMSATGKLGTGSWHSVR